MNNVVQHATLTPSSDTTPVTVNIKKLQGTMYWGGAGLNGAYVGDQLQAFREAGIKSLFVGKTNTNGTLLDAIRAGLTVRYEDDGAWPLSGGLDQPAPQFNLIGYSYGSLLAAQTANYYAKQGQVVDHLVLIGTPIDIDFLMTLTRRRNIKQVHVLNLGDHGDPLFAGIPQSELIMTIPMLGLQMTLGEGHFYYAPNTREGQRRRRALARTLSDMGLR